MMRRLLGPRSVLVFALFMTDVIGFMTSPDGIVKTLLFGKDKIMIIHNESRPMKKRCFRLCSSSTTGPNAKDQDRSSMNNDSSDGGGLVTTASNKSQLFSAFANLDLTDQYDAVLTGLAAKILDAKSVTPEQTVLELSSCYELLQEMNQKRITPSPRSAMAMIDASVKTQTTESMAETMRLLGPRIVQLYGSQQANLRLYPSTSTTKIRCPDGSYQTASERLAKLPDIPSDDRGQEVSAALAVTSIGGALEGVDIFTDYDPIANAILTIMALTLVIDNAYDVIKAATQLISQQIASINNNNNNKDTTSNKAAALPGIKLPEKDQLPFGLGTGKATGVVVKGYTRLLTADPEREAECEAAALVMAYLLGLPCYAFRSNSLEATSLVSTTTATSTSASSSSTIVFRILVWLLSPIAMESASHPILIFSNPQEAVVFMDRCEELFGRNNDQVFWDESNRDLVLKWAYTEADLLLRDNKRIVKDIAQRLAGGAATIGDCVSILEQW